MIFPCFPPTGECEWFYIRDFVDHYNNLYGKTYRLSACLEKEIRNERVPEVLLESPGDTPIVIERKSVVWPRKDFFSNHHKGHYLHEQFVGRIRSQSNSFSDSAYALFVRESFLKGRKKREVKGLAERIADIVLGDQTTAKSRFGIGGQEALPKHSDPVSPQQRKKKWNVNGLQEQMPEIIMTGRFIPKSKHASCDRRPIQWWFRRLHPGERDETVPGTGIDFIVVEDKEHPEPSETDQVTGPARAGYTSEFECSANAAAEKFVNYAHCLRLFLVQFFGDGSEYLRDEEMTKIICSAKLPETIDQVWVACPNWVSETEDEIIWRRVR